MAFSLLAHCTFEKLKFFPMLFFQQNPARSVRLQNSPGKGIETKIFHFWTLRKDEENFSLLIMDFSPTTIFLRQIMMILFPRVLNANNYLHKFLFLFFFQPLTNGGDTFSSDFYFHRDFSFFSLLQSFSDPLETRLITFNHAKWCQEMGEGTRKITSSEALLIHAKKKCSG